MPRNRVILSRVSYRAALAKMRGSGAWQAGILLDATSRRQLPISCALYIPPEIRTCRLENSSTVPYTSHSLPTTLLSHGYACHSPCVASTKGIFPFSLGLKDRSSYAGSYGDHAQA